MNQSKMINILIETEIKFFEQNLLIGFDHQLIHNTASFEGYTIL